MDGKPCGKHKCFTIKNNEEDCLVCEDCLHRSKDVPEYVQICHGCGMSLSEVITKSRLGCAKCYDNFSDSIAYVVASVQRGDSSIEHVGRIPSRFLKDRAKGTSPEDFIKDMEGEMARACAEEDYRRASEIKTKIAEFVEMSKTGRGPEDLVLFMVRHWTGD